MPIISDFKSGNFTNPRADCEIQLVGAGFVYTLNRLDFQAVFVSNLLNFPSPIEQTKPEQK
jgi:hypothetical protein